MYFLECCCFVLICGNVSSSTFEKYLAITSFISSSQYRKHFVNYYLELFKYRLSIMVLPNTPTTYKWSCLSSPTIALSRKPLKARSCSLKLALVWSTEVKYSIIVLPEMLAECLTFCQLKCSVLRINTTDIINIEFSVINNQFPSSKLRE